MTTLDIVTYDFGADTNRLPVEKRNLYLDALSDHHRMGTRVGAAATGVTAVEYGDAFNHTTVLTVNSTLPAIAGGANLAVGKLLYTLPAGRQLINAVTMSMAITQTGGNITADTPDVGVGTVIGAGAVAVLGGTAEFENLVFGVTAANCNGSVTISGGVPTANVPLLRAAADAKTIYFNVADGWAASGDAGALITGTVIVQWSQFT